MRTIPMATGKEVTRLLYVIAVLSLICNGVARNIDLSHTMKDIPGCQCDKNDKNFNETIPDKVMIGCRKCYLFTYEFSKKQDWAAYLCVKSPKASVHSPLLVVVRESLSVMAFQVPLVFSNVSPFTDVCHTLCPLANYFDSKLKPGIQNISIEVSTSSEVWVDYELELATINDFVMVKETPIAVNITPSQPRVLQYDIEKDLRAVRIEATSKDESCMILAIQDVQCPLYDSVRTVEQGGYYQTLTRQSGIAITKKTFPGGRQYVVLILKPTSSSCKESDGTSESEVQHSWKEVTVKVVPAITDGEFYAAVFGALAFFILVYIFCLIICCFISFRRRRALTTSIPSGNAVTITCISNYGTTSDSEIPASLNFCSVSMKSESSGDTDSSNGLRDVVDGRRGSRISIDEADIDKLPEVNHDKNVVRTKTVLYVSDLARKKDKYLSERTKVFSWNLVTIAIFYGLPVVQLVYINQRIVLMTGNQDVCYYNFLCSHQAYGISDFNHFYSNIGYVMLGILFLLLVWRRESLLGDSDANIPLEELTGIPHHFGLMYAMGWALIMEGVLSASYHICPNRANFQFDTAFMYVIATVCMLKLYQARHPDITARSHTTWMILSIVIVLSVGGMLKGGLFVWLLFVFVHLTVTAIVSAKIYYMGRIKINRGIFKRMYHAAIGDMAARSYRPTYPGRFVALSIAVLLNIAVDLYGLIRQPANFGSFLLSVFIMNLMIYLVYYTAMKIWYKEGLRWVPIMYMILSFICWGVALNFFLAKITSWQVTPAESRERNKHCLILNFFDHHDIWHFLSSCALFFSFMVLFTLDDDLVNTKRSAIIVF